MRRKINVATSYLLFSHTKVQDNEASACLQVVCQPYYEYPLDEQLGKRIQNIIMCYFCLYNVYTQSTTTELITIYNWTKSLPHNRVFP